MALCPWVLQGQLGPLLAPITLRQTPLVWGTSLAGQWQGATTDTRVISPSRSKPFQGLLTKGANYWEPLSWQQQLLTRSGNEHLHLPSASASETTCRNRTAHTAAKGLPLRASRCPVRFDKEASGSVGSLCKATPAHPCGGAARAAGAVLGVQLHQQPLPACSPPSSSTELRARCLHPAGDKSLPERTGCTASL